MIENTQKFSEEFAGIKAQSLVFIYESIFRDFIYKDRDMEQFYEQVCEMVPDAGDFFVKWFKGYVFVANRDFDSAEKNYLEALDCIADESDYVPTFLQQGFALLMYLGKNDSAQKFWDCGVEKNIFARNDKKFFDGFVAKEQFWVQFVPKMFVDYEAAQKTAISDYRKNYESELERAVVQGDVDAVEAELNRTDLASFRIKGVSVLYYAVQIKGIIAGGIWKYVDDIVDMRTEQMFSTLNLEKLPDNQRMQHFMTIKHQMKLTYDKSGLAQIMFRAAYCDEEEIGQRVSALEKIISLIAEKTSDVDAFVKQIEGKMGTNALHLAAEVDDVYTCRILIKKGSCVDKIIGYADFGMQYAGGRTVKTEIPNTFVYRLISFRAWNTLKMYLSEFASKASKSMTEKSDKCNITPLVFMILNTIYSSENEEEYNSNKKLVDELIPLFEKAGASLEENTAFGNAGKLLGLSR